ncbi:MAG: efflux RND transporter periplasmic adaptor subunit [Tannerellaceae bacterium]|jgi:RND family efflux transporter MFP subunit|nr:efflux RND transporter periplasmic adaptor subunit [Tannerellaceae bacterium]
MTKIFFVLSTCLLVACGGERAHTEDEGHDHDNGHEEPAAQLSTFVFDAEKAAAVGLKTKVVERSTFMEAIKTSGRISAAQGDEQVLVATLPGVVTFGKASFVEGSAVRKGEAVLSISTGLLAGGDIAIRTRSLYEKAKGEYERAKELIKDRIISEKDFKEALSDYETAKTAFDAIGEVKEGGVDISSPLTGYLKELRVREGDYVEKGAPLATVSQNRRLQLRVELAQRYYGSLSAIDDAYFKTPYDERLYRLSDLNGRLLSYARSVDDGAYYLPVTFEFDNKGAILPGGYVEAYLLTAPIANTIAIPISSLIEEQGLYRVFVRVDEDCYRKQEVVTGNSNGPDIRILSGLEAGDVVVTEAAYHLKLASASNVLPAHHH